MSSASSTSASAGAPAPAAAAAPAPAAASFSLTGQSVSASAARTRTQWDRCLENGLIKTGWGAAIGSVAAIVLFRNRATRFTLMGFGAGIGAGMSYLECKQAYSVPTYRSPLLTPAQTAALDAAPKVCRCGKATCKCGDACKCKPAGFASVDAIAPTFVVPGKK